MEGDTDANLFFLDASADKIGIGTNAPDSQLEIAGGGYNSSLKITGSGADTGIQFEDSGGTTDGYVYAAGLSVGLLDAGTDWTIQCKNDDYIRFCTNGATEHMRIKSDGNVGIGTSSPNHKLEVNGSFAATTKSFLIDHPTKENMRLQYGALEGPENGVYVRGKSNYKIIDLPEYWTRLVDEESITVQLTPIGAHQHLYVEKIRNNQVFVNTDKIQQRRLNYYYIVHAERKDVDKLEVEIEK